jgi:hypothetical protein
MDALKQFYNALNIEESKYRPKLASDNLGLILRSAINELDWYYYNISKVNTPTDDQQEQFYLLQIGVARLIQLSLDTRTSFDVPTVMFRRRRSITIPVLEIVAGIAIIEHGRRVAQTVSSGLCTIELIDTNEFLIKLPSIIPDDEYHERAILTHYQTEFHKQFEELLGSELGKKIRTEVNEKLQELVYPFEKHYIGYGADPILDEYFFRIAFHEIQGHEGFDSFNYAICFGGIPYQKYIFALTFLISFCIRHEHFAEALVEKEPHIQLENILTISSDTEGFIESLQLAINYFGSDYEGFEEATYQEAKLIFEVLSYSRKNSPLLSRPASALPIIIQSSDQSFIRCLTGARTMPVQFLLDSLRYHFTSDYDKHQQSREKSMQTAIKRVLNDGFVGLEYLENIKIRLNGRVLTDIDLVVSEKTTGTVFLCQLKYQDLYGADLHSKHIRTARLKDQIIHWLSSLDDWLNTAGEESIKASLHLRKSFPSLNVYRLVISKHYSYPLIDLAQGADTACANWIQFVNSVELVKKELIDTRQLSDLVAMLKKVGALSGQQSHLVEPQSEWLIGDLKFVVLQE